MKKNKKNAHSGDLANDPNTQQVITLQDYCAELLATSASSEYTAAVDALIDTIPKDVIVRCLRRRFWHALVTEDEEHDDEDADDVARSSSST